MADTPFSGWLRRELDRREITVRGLSRDMARTRDGGSVRAAESMRRAVNKYLHEGVQPSPAMRHLIAGELGVDPADVPTSDDEEEDLAGALHDLTREVTRLRRVIALREHTLVG